MEKDERGITKRKEYALPNPLSLTNKRAVS